MSDKDYERKDYDEKEIKEAIEKGNYDSDRNGFVLPDGNLIRIQDKNEDGNVRISIYDGDEREDHSRITINFNENTGTGTIDEHDEEGNKEETASIGCYLTTACMKHYMDEFDDNCYYLDILRWFRDNLVSKEDKKEYYKVAPKVVETLDSLDNANEVYNQIYTKVIQVCVRLIEYGRYDEAYQIYKGNVLDLQNKFVRKIVPSQE